MLFLLVLVLSLVGAVFFFAAADVAMIWKLALLGLAVTAAVLQFFTPVPFVVPVMMQIVVCLVVVLYWQIDAVRP